MENNTKRYESAVTFGRFNLLHDGHINLFLTMAASADEVVIGLSTNDRNLDVDDRCKVIEAALMPYGINYRIVKASQPFECFDQVKSTRAVTWFGEDQYMLGESAGRKYGWDSEVIERLTSSTAVRSMIDNEDWDLLAKVVPATIITAVITMRDKETGAKSIYPFYLTGQN